MCRIAVFKAEIDDSPDVLQWLDRMLIRLCQNNPGPPTCQFTIPMPATGEFIASQCFSMDLDAATHWHRLGHTEMLPAYYASFAWHRLGQVLA